MANHTYVYDGLSRLNEPVYIGSHPELGRLSHSGTAPSCRLWVRNVDPTGCRPHSPCSGKRGCREKGSGVQSLLASLTDWVPKGRNLTDFPYKAIGRGVALVCPLGRSHAQGFHNEVVLVGVCLSELTPHTHPPNHHVKAGTNSQASEKGTGWSLS